MRIRDLNWLPELIRIAAAEFGDAPALECAQRSRGRLSYTDLCDYMLRAARDLRSRELPPGSRVLLAVESRPEWAAAFFGILEAGMVAVPIPPDTDPHSAAVIAAHAETAATIVSDRTRGVAGELGDLPVILLEELFSHKAAAGHAGGATPGNLLKKSHIAKTGATAGQASSGTRLFLWTSGLAMLAFTSGSTRQPRAVELTHGNLLSNLDAVLQMRGGGPDAALLSMLPPSHLFELVVGLLAPLACGARVVYCDALLPNRIVTAMGEHQITHALAVPALVDCFFEEVTSQWLEAEGHVTDGAGHNQADLAQRLETKLERSDWERLKSVVRAQIGERFGSFVVGGAAIDPALARVVSALGIQVEVGYGLTEAGPVVSLGLTGDCPTGSVGRPLPGVQVRISHDGEILVRGPSVTRGYYHDPALTSAAFEDGWLKTGDHGRLDSNGFLFVTGRLKEAMVTAAGQTIYPEEAQPYYQHPLFAEICVAGLPGTGGNDVPTLFVIPASDQVSSDDLNTAFAELRAAAPPRLRVASMVRLNVPLPKTESGKIRRCALIEQFQQRDAYDKPLQ